MSAAIDQHPDLKARMQAELMRASRSAGCSGCEPAAIRRKWNAKAIARENAAADTRRAARKLRG